MMQYHWLTQISKQLWHTQITQYHRCFCFCFFNLFDATASAARITHTRSRDNVAICTMRGSNALHHTPLHSSYTKAFMRPLSARIIHTDSRVSSSLCGFTRQQFTLQHHTLRLPSCGQPSPFHLSFQGITQVLCLFEILSCMQVKSTGAAPSFALP